MDFIMAMRARVIFFICLLFFTPLAAEAPEPYLKYVDKIIREFEREIVKEFDLVAVGSGGRMPYNVEEISVSFYAYRKATIEEARRMEVAATERLLQKINQDEKIRPYLKEYPFKADRATVSISFCKRDNSRYSDGSVAYMFQVRNRIIYCGFDLKADDYYDLLEEPYEDALKLVKQ